MGMEVIRWISPRETNAWLELATAELSLPGEAAQAVERLNQLFARHPILTARIDPVRSALFFRCGAPGRTNLERSERLGGPQTQNVQTL